MKLCRRALISFLATLLVGAYFRGAILPWASPHFAATYAVADDGKDPTNSSRAAARHWGKPFVSALAVETNNFKSLTPVTAFTLSEVLAETPSCDYSNVLSGMLFASENPNALILGCYLAPTEDDRCNAILEGDVSTEFPRFDRRVPLVKRVREELAREAASGVCQDSAR